MIKPIATISKKCCLWERCLFLGILPLCLFVPPIHIGFLPFSLGISDFLLVSALFFIIKNGWYQGDNKRIVFIFSVLACYILFTMLLNRQLMVLNSYFEIYDIFKLAVFFVFFRESFEKNAIRRILDASCIALIVFHIFHYYNLLDFNAVVMPHYCGSDSPHLIFFGYNSLGEPATKRALGVLGNPNNNAILFLFFLMLYAPRGEWARKDAALFFVTLIPFACCQSRTGLIAFAAMVVVNYIFAKIGWRKVMLQMAVIVAVIAITLNFAALCQFLPNPLPVREKNYALTMLDASMFSTGSWTERLSVWKELGAMIADKPIFGHSPDKNYFYTRKLYAENEYILMAWRYGMVGLLCYIALYLVPFVHVWRKARSSVSARRVLMATTVFAITALTNCPLSCGTLALFLMFVYAAFYSEKAHISHPDFSSENTEIQ